jgi:hypothetical protein
MLLGRYYGSGMLGLGLTALLASFMSGMAGNITAFNTVFTYDIYQTYLVKNRPDAHYLRIGKVDHGMGNAAELPFRIHRVELRQLDGLHATDWHPLYSAIFIVFPTGECFGSERQQPRDFTAWSPVPSAVLPNICSIVSECSIFADQWLPTSGWQCGDLLPG